MTIRVGPGRRFTPKPMPKTGSLQDLAEGLVWAFQQWTPEQQQTFRDETMRSIRAKRSSQIWEEENPMRPYARELKN